MRSVIHALAIVIALLPASASHGSIIAVGEFTGQYSDTFNQYSTTMAELSLPVFGGQGTLQMLSPGGAIKVEFSSTFAGYQVEPISGMMVGQLGVAQWVFNQPITKFGGWFENNSGQDDATISFFTPQNTLIGTVNASVPFAEGWTWNGWTSDDPIGRILVVGNGTMNGFLWYENMQMDVAVPGPAAAALIGVGVLTLGARRRRS